MNAFDLVAQTATKLPQWLNVLAAIAAAVAIPGFLLALSLAVVRWREGTTSRPDLYFHLTRDLVFQIRPTDGECLCIEGVWLAVNAPATIRKISAELTQTTGQNRSFRLKVIGMGEKVFDDEGNWRFASFSTSPLFVIPPGDPTKLVYRCGQQDFANDIRLAFLEFGLELGSVKREAKKARENQDEQLAQSVVDRLDSILEETANAVAAMLQVCPGDFRLKVTVEYEQRTQFSRRLKRHDRESTIAFKLRDGVNAWLRYSIRQHCEAAMRRVVFETGEPVRPVEYRPGEVEEE